MMKQQTTYNQSKGEKKRKKEKKRLENEGALY